MRQISCLPDSAHRVEYGTKRVGKPRQNWLHHTKKYVYENILGHYDYGETQSSRKQTVLAFSLLLRQRLAAQSSNSVDARYGCKKHIHICLLMVLQRFWRQLEIAMFFYSLGFAGYPFHPNGLAESCCLRARGFSSFVALSSWGGLISEMTWPPWRPDSGFGSYSKLVHRQLFTIWDASIPTKTIKTFHQTHATSKKITSHIELQYL